ncbi:MAG TPA: hypothetical protein DCS93_34325 [Microscillaceae bacterium]|nr:hypothetical protein [Microscillaceae bacterium]
MKKTILILICVLCTSNLLAQNQRVISGIIRDTNGNPIPGAILVIKGTTNGVATDHKGYYRLQVRIGDVVIIQALGLVTREVTINEHNSKISGGSVSLMQEITIEKIKYYDYSKIFKPNNQSAPAKNKPGVGVLTDTAPSYKTGIIPAEIEKIKYQKPSVEHPNGHFDIQRVLRPIVRYSNEWRFNWKHSTTLNRINRLPHLQNAYAQGRSVNGIAQWQGPETGEIFSWGPAIANLNYDNSTPYAYDQNGALATNGNGLAAQAYDPLKFFRTGLTINNVLESSKQLYQGQLYVQAKDQRNWLPWPGAKSRNNLVRLRWNQNKFRANIQYYNQGATLPNRGANWQNLIGSVLSTAPTFDQSNGLKRRSALKQRDSYVLNDGSLRTPAPGLLDNPYGLVNQMPDIENQERLVGSAGITQQIDLQNLLYSQRDVLLTLDFDVNFESGGSRYLLGLHPQSSGANLGRMTQRDQKKRLLNLNLKSSINPKYWNEYMKLSIQQSLSFERQTVNRRNAFGFDTGSFGNIALASQIDDIELRNFRRVYQLMPSLELKYRLKGWNLALDLANQFYFSSTLAAAQNTRYLPAFQLRLRHYGFSGIPAWFSANVGYTRTLRETPLIYNQWHYNTTNVSLANYQQYFESAELSFSTEVSPEIQGSWEFGISFEYDDVVRIGINYHDQLTKNHLLPQLNTTGSFDWRNVGEIRNRGFEIFLNARVDFESDYYWKSYINWFRYRPIVTQLYNNTSQVPLTGYQEVGTHLVAGQPYGVIVGNKYARVNNQILIGADGFPVTDPNLGVLGNPNPEWVLQWGNSLKLNRFQLDWVLAYRHGGQRWNGTQAMLDYLGVSQQTADLRNTQGFVYQGVNAAGEPNQVAVDFANATNGLSGNRWVRYGVGGVAEDYIQSASSLRFEEIKLSYQVGEFLGIAASRLVAAIFVQNLLLTTPYQGLDPNTTFLSEPTHQGLDLFNTPAMTSWGIQFNISY